MRTRNIRDRSQLPEIILSAHPITTPPAPRCRHSGVNVTSENRTALESTWIRVIDSAEWRSGGTASCFVGMLISRAGGAVAVGNVGDCESGNVCEGKWMSAGVSVKVMMSLRGECDSEMSVTVRMSVRIRGCCDEDDCGMEHQKNVAVAMKILKT